MNRYLTFVPIVVLILSVTGIVTPAFAATIMTMETDRTVYAGSK